MHKLLTGSLGASVLIAALGLSATATADSDDLITTASTAGTTAYLVGKEVDKDDFARARDFADTRAVALRREAATGGGENLDALASLLGEQNPEAFGQWVQSHYTQIYVDNTGDTNLANRVVVMR